jgi:hypothetical protein
MDNREIARALGRSDGATKVLIHRAIRQLEEIVGDRDDGQATPVTGSGRRAGSGTDAQSASEASGGGSDE